MKKTICMLMAALMVLSLAACGSGNADKADSGKQTASAYLDQDGNCVTVTADLSGGWSVEFARGAAYLYDGEITEGKESVATLTTLDKEVYEDHLANAMADGGHKEANGGVYYTYDENEGAYLTSIGDSAFVLITANKKDIEAIAARFALSLEN